MWWGGAVQSCRIVALGAWIGLVLLVCACGDEEKEEAPREPKTRVVVALSAGYPKDAVLLRSLAHERNLDLLIEDCHGRVSSQLEQIRTLVDLAPAVVLLFPASPTVIEGARAMGEAAQIPIVVVERGVPGSGPWVGLGVQTGVAEQIEDLAQSLASRGVDRPRLVLVEHPRWTGSGRRTEALVDALEEMLGSVEIVRRVQIGEERLGKALGLDPARTAFLASLNESGDESVDVVLCGDLIATRAVLQVSSGPEGPLVLGVVALGAQRDPPPDHPRFRLASFDRREMFARCLSFALSQADVESAEPLLFLPLTLPGGELVQPVKREP